MGGYVGLCARYEHHEALAAGDPQVASIWIDLKQVTDEARRRWRASTFGEADDQMPCSLPGCGGLVKPEYLVEADGAPMGPVRNGLYTKRSHAAIPRQPKSSSGSWTCSADHAAEFHWPLETAAGNFSRTAGSLCSIPGCDGVVAAQYVLDSDEGEVGICGIAAAHARLISIDPIRARRVRATHGTPPRRGQQRQLELRSRSR